MTTLVPGLLRDKLIALIRQLPKPVRRSLTPVPAFADALLESMQQRGDEPMLEVCAGKLQAMTGLQLGILNWTAGRLEFIVGGTRKYRRRINNRCWFNNNQGC